MVLRAEAYRAAGPFDPAFGGCYDLDVWLRIARLRPGNLCAIPEELTDYRRRSGQLTKNTRMMEGSWLQLIEKMRPLEPELVARAAPGCCVNLYRFLSYANYEQGEMRESFRCLWLSIKYQPWGFVRDHRNWCLLAIQAANLVLPRRWQTTLVQRGARWLTGLRPA